MGDGWTDGSTEEEEGKYMWVLVFVNVDGMQSLRGCAGVFFIQLSHHAKLTA